MAPPTRDELRGILMAEWDPIGVAGEPLARDEYDAYLDPIIKLLDTGEPASAIARYLATVEAEQMEQGGTPQDRIAHLLPTATRILSAE